MTDPEVTHQRWILGVAPGLAAAGGHAGPPRVALERRRLLVIDAGTGLGAGLSAMLGIDDDTAADVVAAEVRAGADPTVVEGGTITVRLEAVADPVGTGREAVVAVVVRAEPGGGGAAPSTWRVVASAVPDRLLSLLTRARLDDHPDWPHLHGGALSDQDGRAVLVLGRSGAGKSTLVANLAAAGLGLLNDEQVSLHRRPGLVGGFTRPVAVKPGGARHLPATVGAGVPDTGHTELVPAAALGTRHRVFAEPALVVLPERGDEHGEPSWERLDPSSAVAALAANNLDLTRVPVEGLSAYAWLVTTVPVVTVRYREAADVVALVSGLLADPPPVPTLAWAVGQVPGEPDVVPLLDAGGGRSAGATTAGGTVGEVGRSSNELVGGSGGCTPELHLPVVEDAGPPALLSVAPVAGVVELHLGGELVLFEPQTRHLATLNPAAAAVWSTLPWCDVAIEDPALAPVFDLVRELAAQGLVRLDGPRS